MISTYQNTSRYPDTSRYTVSDRLKLLSLIPYSFLLCLYLDTVFNTKCSLAKKKVNKERLRMIGFLTIYIVFYKLISFSVVDFASIRLIRCELLSYFIGLYKICAGLYKISKI